MLFLRTDADLPSKTREALRKEVKELTGEDCVILTCGLSVERIPVAKDKAASGEEAAL